MTVFVRPWRGDRSGKVWEYDVKLRWPDGSKARERKRSPCTSKSATQRYAEERERLLIAAGSPSSPKEVTTEEKKAPLTLRHFEAQYLDEHCVAERQGVSTLVMKRSVLRCHLLVLLGDKPMGEISNGDVQALKARMASLAPKTVTTRSRS